MKQSFFAIFNVTQNAFLTINHSVETSEILSSVGFSFELVNEHLPTAPWMTTSKLTAEKAMTNSTDILFSSMEEPENDFLKDTLIIKEITLTS